MSDRIKEEIKLSTEWLKFLIVCAIADISGLTTLLRLEKQAAIEYTLIVIGFFLLACIIIGIVATQVRIKSRIKKL